MVAAVVFAIVAALGWWRAGSEVPTSTPRRVTVALAPHLQLRQSETQAGVAVSPDGQTIAYRAYDLREFADDRAVSSGFEGVHWYIQRLDELAPRAVIDGGKVAFAPDSRWLAIRDSTTSLSKVSLEGGGPQRICTTCLGPGSALEWGADGYIYFGTAPGLQRVHAAGGEPESVTEIDSSRGEIRHLQPRLVPGSDALVFRVFHADGDSNIEVLVPSTGQRKLLVEDAGDGRVLPSGHLVYVSEPNVWVVPFDVDKLEVTGTGVPLPEQPMTNWWNGRSHWSVSRQGQLIYVPDPGPPQIELVRVNAGGAATSIGAPLAHYGSVTATRNGERAAVTIRGRGRRWGVAVYDARRGTLTRITDESDDANHAVWSPDERRLAFALQTDNRNSWRLVAADVAPDAEPEPLVESGFGYAIAWTRDGSRFVYSASTGEAAADIWEVDLRTSERRVLVQTDVAEFSMDLSPDERWLAFTRLGPDGSDLFVQSYPEAGSSIQISAEGADFASWAPSGDQLYYTNGNRIMAVSAPDNGTSSFGRPRELFRFTHINGFFSAGFTAIEGGEFIFLRVAEEPPPFNRLILVTNWFDELKRLVPTDP